MRKGPAKTDKPGKPLQERVAVYAGSFDPPTLGHLDMVVRAAALFDRLIVGVGAAAAKKPMFSTEERLEMLRELCGGHANVEVAAIAGLVADFARSHGARFLVRGLRSGVDYDYEVQMAFMNRALAPELETVFIPTRPELSHISSSLAKDLANHHGAVELLAPPAVARRLRSKFT